MCLPWETRHRHQSEYEDVAQDLSWNISFRKKLYENLSEINFKELISDGENAIKKISNVSKIAEKAEKVIEDAVEKLKIISSESPAPSDDQQHYKEK